MANIELTNQSDTYVQPASDIYSGNRIFGLGGNDTIYVYSGNVEGGAGNDTIARIVEGNSSWGEVTATFDTATAAVRVDLLLGFAEDGLGGRDTLLGVNNANGTSKADWFRGNDNANFFWVSGGNDTVIGGGGADTIGLSWFDPGGGQPWRQARFEDLVVDISPDAQTATIRPRTGTGFAIQASEIESIAYWSSETNQVVTKLLSDYLTQDVMATRAVAAGGTYRWNASAPLGTPTTLTYAFVTQAPADASLAAGFRAFTDAERALVREILKETSALTGLTFTEAPAAGAQLRLGVNQQAATKGIAGMPGTTRAGEIWMDVESMVSLAPGTEGYAALLHEIGHALGLRHPRNVDAGEAWSEQLRAQDDRPALTVMSQTAPADGLHRSDWGPLDVLALRHLYGTRSALTGNDTYTFGTGAMTSKQTLVDDGGTDRLDASAAVTGVSLSLVPGSMSSVGRSTTGQAAVENLAIPQGVVIEEAIGSAFDDFIVGNDADNHLQGNAGNDWVDGGAGFDTAAYGSPRSAYRVTLQFGRVLVEAVDGLSGTDTLVNIERLQFTDQFQSVSAAAGVDDFTATVQTTGSVPVGGATRGKLEAPGDADWLRVALTAGQSYQLDLGGAADLEGTLGEGASRGRLTLYDSAGTVLQAGIRTQADNQPLLSFQPTSSGTYYLGVDEIFGTGTGAYQVSARIAQVATRLVSGSGDETLVGTVGVDTAVYDGAVSQYTVAINRAGRTATITDSQSGRDGRDQLQGVEKIEFGGQVFDLFNPPRTETPQIGKARSFLFDAAYYRLANPELANTVSLESAADHYLQTGAALGKKPNTWFDAAYYANRWADLKGANLDAATLFMHYNLFGVWEGRSAGPTYDKYDGVRYLRDNPDVAAYVDAYVADFLGSRSNGAMAHYVIYGSAEGRVVYDTLGKVIDAAVVVGVAA